MRYELTITRLDTAEARVQGRTPRSTHYLTVDLGNVHPDDVREKARDVLNRFPEPEFGGTLRQRWTASSEITL